MVQFTAEIIGTMILVLLGNGVVANVVLKDTKGHAAGWDVITLGWGLAVFVGVIITGKYSGAHINPAVTLGLALAGTFPWQQVPLYIGAQMIGAMLGASLVWLMYRDHFDATEDGDSKLAVFCTGPEIRKYSSNFVSELIGTFVLVFTILYTVAPSLSIEGAKKVTIGLGALGALPVALLVVAIGMSLGGTTGYAINPARDLGPRIMHALLPVKNKRDSDWKYAWIPVLGPVTGALLAAGLFKLLSEYLKIL